MGDVPPQRSPGPRPVRSGNCPNGGGDYPERPCRHGRAASAVLGDVAVVTFQILRPDLRGKRLRAAATVMVHGGGRADMDDTHAVVAHSPAKIGLLPIQEEALVES